MSATLEKFKRFVNADVTRRQDAAAQMEVSDIKATLTTPYPPASVPGESPHKRTGELQAGVNEATVTSEGGSILTSVTSSRVEDNPNVPMYLEFGTIKMAPRPYMRPSINRVKENFLRRVASA